MYNALAQYRNQWGCVQLGACDVVLHGILLEVNREYIKLLSHRDDGKKNTEYIRLDLVTRFSPDAPELFESQMESAFGLDDDDDGKELARV